MRVWWNLLTSKLRVAFLEEPSVSWDIDLKVSVIELPDLLEDGLAAYAVQKMLAGFGPEAPLEIQLEKFMQTMVKESLDAGGGKASHASRVLSQPGFLKK